jgi:anti-sigma factor RsiW
MPERHDDVPAYLVGALNDLERQAFERHLMGCSTCQTEVEQLRPAVEALNRDVEPVDPPPTLKTGLMAVVEREAALRRPAPARARASWRRPALAAALAATLALAGVGGFAIGRLGDDSRSIAAQVDSERLPGVSGRLVRSDDAAVLRLSGLPALPAEQAYAIWVDRGGELTAVGLVEPTATGTAQAGIDDLGDASGVYVTREKGTDVRRPSEEPVVSVSLQDA